MKSGGGCAFRSSCVPVNSAGLIGHVSTSCRSQCAIAREPLRSIWFFTSLRADLYSRSGQSLRLGARRAKKQKRTIRRFVICMVYGLQEISLRYGGFDGDWSRGSEIDGSSGELGTATWASAGGAGVSAADSRGSYSTPFFAQRVPIRLLRARLLYCGRRERPMEGKFEKSIDNRCAALVSREPRAPRARQNCKPCMVNTLRLMSPLTRARGAQVSRAAREPNGGRDCTTKFSRPACSELVEPACRALSTLRGVAGATPSKNGNVTPMSHECH